jgi:hypothetical protein
MAEYIAQHAPGHDITLTASAAITGGQLLVISGDDTVAPSAGTDESWVGVATTDADSGARVGITSGGVQRLTAAAAITAGDLVVPAAAGQVAPIPAVDATAPTTADANNTRAIVGLALAGAAAGAPTRVKLAR